MCRGLGRLVVLGIVLVSAGASSAVWGVSAAAAISVAEAEADSGRSIVTLAEAVRLPVSELTDLLASVPAGTPISTGPSIGLGQPTDLGGCQGIGCEVEHSVDEVIDQLPNSGDPTELLPELGEPGELLPTVEDPRELLPTTGDPGELLPTVDDPTELLPESGGQPDPNRCIEELVNPNTLAVCSPADDGPHCHGSLDWVSIYYRTVAGYPMYRMKGYNSFACRWTYVKCTFKVIAGGVLITAGANAGIGGCAALGPAGALARGGDGCECIATIAGITTKVVYPFGTLHSHSPMCKAFWKVAVCAVVTQAEVESSGLLTY
jgi:hypothetical protein